MPRPPRRSSAAAPRPRQSSTNSLDKALARTNPPKPKGKRRKASASKRFLARLAKWPIGYGALFMLGLALWFQFFRMDSVNAEAAASNSEVQLATFDHSDRLSAGEIDVLRRSYIADYRDIARKEMRKFGIPASITLAQGLLESVAGTSRLATETNNHFGIKCFSRRCRKGHCRNFSDDHHKDFFRNYEHPRESFRAHSEFLADNGRYDSLFKLGRKDYAAWARGLGKAGYATDPHYARKLVSLIERYELAAFDE